MPRMHQCKEVGCHRLIPYNKSYCPLHEKNHQQFNYYSKESNKAYNQQRYNPANRKYTRFYKSQQWRKIRKYVIAKSNGLCEECLRHGYINPGKIVDHKIPLRTAYGWIHRLDIDNLQYLCQQCHNDKTKYEREHWNPLINKYGKDKH